MSSITPIEKLFFHRGWVQFLFSHLTAVFPHVPAIFTHTIMFVGIDDLQMCELSLEETGLARKRGAEILQQEFESEWSRNGGEHYVMKHKSKITSSHLKQVVSQMKANRI